MTALAHTIGPRHDADLPPPGPQTLLGVGWPAWVGVGTSVAILATVAWHLGNSQLIGMLDQLPGNPGFWLLFVVFYLTQPVGDWVIFRRLWGLPLAGLLPLLKKRVSNDLLLGYSGEVYFYAWARQHLRLETSPFGAVKDVTIVSAMVGNLVTLVLLAVSAPMLVAVLPRLSVEVNGWALVGSLGIVVASSLVVVLLRNRVLSLDRGELRFTAGVHLARVLAGLGVSAVMWHLALPQVALGWWLVLATWRQVVSRLPLLPNKDVVFAAAAVVLMGGQGGIAALMTLIATLLLVTNIVVAVGLAIGQLATGRASAAA